MKTHRFAHIEDYEERRRWQNPEAILTEIGLKPGSVFVDVGCGGGFFAIPAAKIVGKNGRVCGLDIDPAAVHLLKTWARKERLSNVSLTAGAAEESVLCEACADIVFFGIVLHDFRDVSKVLANAKKMLKSSGRLVDLDWKKKPMTLGPPLQIRFDEEEAMNHLKRSGFKIESVRDIGPYHYMIVAEP